MNIYKNYCLKENNTFKVNVNADTFIEYDSDAEILLYFNDNKEIFSSNLMVLGEGSNILFTDNFTGTIIHPKTKEINILKEFNDKIFVKASAGVIWDDFVEWTIKNKAYGLENLSLIPGTVGAAAVQNIGAYGSEVGNFIDSVTYFDLKDKRVVTISGKECEFGYRCSIFKTELKNRILILSANFCLNKFPVLNTDYADIKNFFGTKTDINALELRNAVIQIRNNKLPDPKIIGNAGSFFKNPVVNREIFDSLVCEFPDLRYYILNDGNYKIAAGWMIDKCGLKGFEQNGVAVHEKQALVIINKSGNISGRDIVEFSEFVQSKVFEMFNIKLEPEVIFV
jgi:UDP-N-acetylmuramate dehydrogenase